MSQLSKIEWTDATWNPVRGCSRVSEGCRNCYAERVAARFSTHAYQDGDEPGGVFAGFAEQTKAGPRWTGRVELIPSKLDEPLRWRKPRRIFVNSMSDLFHESLSDEAIAAVFGVMAACPQHTFQVLTKRPERMRRWFEWVAKKASMQNVHGITPAALCFWNSQLAAVEPGALFGASAANRALRMSVSTDQALSSPWPLPNVWLGVSVEDQASFDERILHLVSTPAALRFISYEPALGPLDCSLPVAPMATPLLRPSDPKNGPGCVHWLIVGGESGPGARPFDLAWARSAIAQCREAGVPVFVKQLGARPVDPENDEPKCSVSGCGLPECEDFGCQYGIRGMVRSRKGSRPSEWPEDLRVREFPS